MHHPTLALDVCAAAPARDSVLPGAAALLLSINVSPDVTATAKQYLSGYILRKWQVRGGADQDSCACFCSVCNMGCICAGYECWIGARILEIQIL